MLLLLDKVSQTLRLTVVLPHRHRTFILNLAPDSDIVSVHQCQVIARQQLYQITLGQIRNYSLVK